MIHWAKLRKRLTRQFGPLLYIQTWEAHRSGYPHVNLCVSNASFHAAAGREGRFDNPRFLLKQVKESGFGWKCYAEPIRDAQRMAGYLTKLGLELAGAAQKNQVPVRAPPHFRRIRSSRGLLPKRFKDLERTGSLVRISVQNVKEALDL